MPLKPEIIQRIQDSYKSAIESQNSEELLNVLKNFLNHAEVPYAELQKVIINLYKGAPPELVKKLITFCSDCKLNSKGNTFLHQISAVKDADNLDICIKTFNNILNLPNAAGETPLSLALINNNELLVNKLIDAGANLHIRDESKMHLFNKALFFPDMNSVDDKRLPIFLNFFNAAYLAKLKIIDKFLLLHMALYYESKDDENSEKWIKFRHILNVLKLNEKPKLLQKILDFTDGHYHPLIWTACARLKNKVIASALLEAGADINMPSAKVKNIEEKGCYNGYVLTMNERYSTYPIHEVCLQKNVEMLKFLLENEANALSITGTGISPLYIASQEDVHPEIFELLLKYGASPGLMITTNSGDTALNQLLIRALNGADEFLFRVLREVREDKLKIILHCITGLKELKNKQIKYNETISENLIKKLEHFHEECVQEEIEQQDSLLLETLAKAAPEVNKLKKGKKKNKSKKNVSKKEIQAELETVLEGIDKLEIVLPTSVVPESDLNESEKDITTNESLSQEKIDSDILSHNSSVFSTFDRASEVEDITYFEPECFKHSFWKTAYQILSDSVIEQYKKPHEIFLSGSANIKLNPGDLDFVVLELSEQDWESYLNCVQQSQKSQKLDLNQGLKILQKIPLIQMLVKVGLEITAGYTKKEGRHAGIVIQALLPMYDANRQIWSKAGIDFNFFSPHTNIQTYAQDLDVSIGAIFYNIRTRETLFPIENTQVHLATKELVLISPTPEARLLEDPSIILRMVRFIAQTRRMGQNFVVSQTIREAIFNVIKNNPDILNMQVGGRNSNQASDKCYSEMKKLFAPGYALYTLNCLNEFGLLPYFFRDLFQLVNHHYYDAILFLMNQAAVHIDSKYKTFPSLMYYAVNGISLINYNHSYESMCSFAQKAGINITRESTENKVKPSQIHERNCLTLYELWKNIASCFSVKPDFKNQVQVRYSENNQRFLSNVSKKNRKSKMQDAKALSVTLALTPFQH